MSSFYGTLCLWTPVKTAGLNLSLHSLWNFYCKSAPIVSIFLIFCAINRHCMYENTNSGLHTGWSASSSEPYIRTLLAHRSKSEIFLGNQGVQSTPKTNISIQICCLTEWKVPKQCLMSDCVHPGVQYDSPSWSRVELSDGAISTMSVCFLSSSVSSFSCSCSESQSTKISKSESLRLDLRDSIWTRLMCFSCTDRVPTRARVLSTITFQPSSLQLKVYSNKRHQLLTSRLINVIVKRSPGKA